MYRIFVNEKPLILTDVKQHEKGFLLLDFEQVHFDEIIDRLYTTSIQGAHIYHSNLAELKQQFFNHFQVQEACGGVTFNTKNEVLCIYRFDVWDFPKGRMEKGEDKPTTAIREVEEECGVNQLKITKQLPTTYHMYVHKNKHILKVTHWFEMTTTFDGVLVPQLEESITKAEFLSLSEAKKRFKNTYKNIQILLDLYQ